MMWGKNIIKLLKIVGNKLNCVKIVINNVSSIKNLYWRELQNISFVWRKQFFY